MSHVKEVWSTAFIFLVLTACSMPESTGISSDQQSESKKMLDSAANEVWQRALQKAPHLRLKSKLPVTEIPDITYKSAVEDAEFAKHIIGLLKKIPDENLDHEDWLTKEMIRHRMEQKVDELEFYWLNFPVTPYTGGFRLGSIASVLKAVQFSEASERDRYLGLLEEYTDMLVQILEKLQGQADRDIFLPKPAISGAIDLFRGYRNDANRMFLVEPEQLSSLDKATEAQFTNQLHTSVSTKIVPAFDKIIDYLDQEYHAKAPEAVGLYQYPKGKRYYRYLVRKYTLAGETPESIFEYGQQRVAEIAGELQRIRDDLGFKGTQDQFHRMLRTDPRFLAQTPEQVEQRYKQYISRIEPFINDYFIVKPKAPYGVKRLDLASEPGMTFGYYESPTPASPIGLYRYNGSNLISRSLIGAGHLIYHELIPGHHFQFSLQQENKKLPLIRRELLGSSAFSEGWAEYGAELAQEIGLFVDPYDRYGHLLFEMFVTVRLVVDSGMNYFGWPLVKTREYMKKHLFQSELQIASESLRYSTDRPGQALSYKFVQKTILELRDRAQFELGRRFDIRKFHQVLIGSGSIDLAVLEKHIQWYIEKEKSDMPLNI